MGGTGNEKRERERESRRKSRQKEEALLAKPQPNPNKIYHRNESSLARKKKTCGITPASETIGVSFTNILRAAFAHADPKKVKRH